MDKESHNLIETKCHVFVTDTTDLAFITSNLKANQILSLSLSLSLYLSISLTCSFSSSSSSFLLLVLSLVSRENVPYDITKLKIHSVESLNR